MYSIALPRGCEDAVTNLLREKDVDYRFDDKTNHGSVNILGFHSVEDNLIRFKNPGIATSLLEALHKDS